MCNISWAESYQFDDLGSPGGMDYGMDMEGYGEEMGDMMDDYGEEGSQQQVRYKFKNNMSYSQWVTTTV